VTSPKLPKFLTVGLFAIACLLTPHLPAAEWVQVPSIWPRGSVWHKQLVDASRDVARATQGRVEVRLVDQAVVEYVPELGIYSLPLVFRSDEELAYVRSKMDSKLESLMSQRGLIPLAIEGVGAGHIFSVSKDIDTLTEFQNSRLWIPKGKASDTFNSFGINNPVPASLAEVRIKLTRDNSIGNVASLVKTDPIETVVATPSTVMLARWQDKIAMGSKQPLMHFVAPLVVYRKQFDDLSKADQEATKTILAKAFSEAGQSFRAKDQEALGRLQANGSVEIKDFVKPTASDWSAWSDSVINQLVKQGEISGSLVDELRGHLQDYRAAN